MILSSYEARSFFTGPVPDVVVRRFWNAGSWEGPGPGPDRDWPDNPGWATTSSSAPDLGMKVRAEPGVPSRLEFKDRMAADGWRAHDLDQPAPT